MNENAFSASLSRCRGAFDRVHWKELYYLKQLLHGPYSSCGNGIVHQPLRQSVHEWHVVYTNQYSNTAYRIPTGELNAAMEV